MVWHVAAHFHGVHLPADKTGGKKFSKEFEEASSKLEEFVNGLDKQVKNGPSLTEALENAGIFYEAQYKEVKVVANVSVLFLDSPQVEQHLPVFTGHLGDWKMPYLSIPTFKSLWDWCKGGFQREQNGGFGQDKDMLSKSTSWNVNSCMLLEFWIPSRFLKRAKLPLVRQILNSGNLCFKWELD